MSTTPRINLIGFYNYDPGLFDYLDLPKEINKHTFIDTVLLKHGEMPVLYTNPEFYKGAIGIWSRKNRDNLIRIATALNSEFNPVYNYDRYEEYEDSEERTDKTDTKKTVNGSNSSELDTSGTNENRVSAYNSNDYQPDTIESSTGKSQSENTYSSGENDAETSVGERNLKHKAHLYGNIGVTTATAMIKEVVELYQTANIYDIAAHMFADDLLLQYY